MSSLEEIAIKTGQFFYSDLAHYYLQMTTPGPGTYGKGGVPFAALEEKKRRPTSTKGMLDSKSTARSHQTVVSGVGDFDL